MEGKLKFGNAWFWEGRKTTTTIFEVPWTAKLDYFKCGMSTQKKVGCSLSSSKMVVRENLGKKPGHQQLFPWQKIMKHWPTWIDWMQLTNFANLILSMNIFSFICLQYEDSPYILAYSFIDDSSDNLVLNQTSIIIWVIRL